MDIALSLLDQMVQKLSDTHLELDSNEEKRISKAFTLLAVKNVLNMADDEAVECIFDGSGDYGIDALSVSDVSHDSFVVSIFQSKYKRPLNYDGTNHFPSNEVLKMIQVIKTIFDPLMAIEAKRDIKDKIEEIRSILKDEGAFPKVNIYLCHNGQGLDEQGKSHIENASFSEEFVKFEYINHDKIIELSKSKESVNDQLQFQGKSIQEDFDFKRIYIGKVNISEFSRLFEQYGDRLLERNIRKFLGIKANSINANIQKTIEGDERQNFFFLNNGITILVSELNFNGLQASDHLVKLKNINIINGGQTCKTIQNTLKDNPNLDVSQCFVLVRIYKIDEEGENQSIANSITLATNSQNVVNLRDLKSNDEIQRQLIESVELLGQEDGMDLFCYQPKQDSASRSSKHLSVSIGVAAEAIFSTWLNEPHKAKFHKGRLFGALYGQIFNDSLNGAKLILAILIWRQIENNRKRNDTMKEKYVFINYASHILCLIIGNKLLKIEGIPYQDVSHKNFKQLWKSLENNFDLFYQEALETVNQCLGELNVEVTISSLQKVSATFRRSDLTDKVLEKL